MKKITFFVFLLHSLYIFSQTTVTEIAYETDQNFVKITQLDNGNYLTFSHGITAAEPNGINVFSIDATDDSTTHVSECAQVYYPESHLFANGVHMFNDATGVVVMSQNNSGYGQTGIFKTYNGGLTWENKYNLPVDSGLDRITDLLFFDDSNGIALGSLFTESMIIKTTDGGENWSVIHTFPLHLEALSQTGEDSFMVIANKFVSYEPTMWKVFNFTEFGDSYEEISSIADDTKEVKKIQMLNSEVGYVSLYTWESLEYDYIYRTIDGGNSWVEISNFSEVMEERMKIQKLYFFNEQEGFVLAGDYCNDTSCYRGGSLLKTIDGGVNWTVEYKIAPSNHNFWDMALDNSIGEGYIVGGNISNAQGTIHKMVYEPFISLQDLIKIDYITLFPNPSSGTVTMQFDNLNTKASLQVYNTLGQLVLTEEINDISTKNYTFEKGTYIYRLISEDTFDIGTFIIQ